MSTRATHHEYLIRASELAARGAFAVEPNPRVGAVVVKDGRIVGEGWHSTFGGAHAEINALRAAGAEAAGATLYVSLEPCSTRGKTPACTQAIIAAGVARVVYSAEDPNPSHAGRARAVLGPAGINVDGPLAPELSGMSLSRFVRHLSMPRPYVIAKWAMTLDGRIATRGGDSKWISNSESRRIVHELRGHCDAIAVGVGTVLADRPRLTARPPGPLVARRIVFDRELRTPLDWESLDDGESEIVIVTGPDPLPERKAALEARRVRLISVDAETAAEHVAAGLRELRKLGVHRLLVEGGGKVFASFFEAHCVDQVLVFVAPRIVGGAAAISPIAGVGAATIASGIRLVETDVSLARDPDTEDGADAVLRGFVLPG